MQSGLLLIDKEAGMTSHDVVERLRKLLQMREIGHAGTLDPIATGLLVCLVGEATKLSQYVMTQNKSYRVGIKFGIRTDSGDVSGNIIEETNSPFVEQEKLISAIEKLIGEVNLPVPKYSAIKIQGKKLYEYARENQEVEVPVKKMNILKAALVEHSTQSSVVDIECEKGTYVRSWVEELGRVLGCPATVEALRRTRSGEFNVEQSSTVTALEEHRLEAFDKLIPMKKALNTWPELKVIGRDLNLVRNGQIPNGIIAQAVRAQLKTGLRLIDESENLVALVAKDEMKGFKLARVFH